MPGDPPTLAIECSNPPAGAGVAVAPPGAVPLAEPLDPHAGPGEDLIPAIDRLLRRAAVRPADLGAIAVSIGPGGYTSLRIAVAAAKAIASTAARLRGRPVACLPVPTAAAVHRRLEPARRDGRRVLVALAWKRRSVWVQPFPPAAAPGPGALVTLDALHLAAGDLLVADAALADRLRDHGRLPAGVETIAPILDPLAVLDVARQIPPVTPMDLLPLYPREPEAVTKWRDRAAGQSS